MGLNIQRLILAKIGSIGAVLGKRRDGDIVLKNKPSARLSNHHIIRRTLLAHLPLML